MIYCLIILFAGFALYIVIHAWPFFLGLAVLCLIGYIINTIKEIIDDIVNYIKSTRFYKFFDKLFNFNLNINFALIFDSLALIILSSFLIFIIAGFI